MERPPGQYLIKYATRGLVADTYLLTSFSVWLKMNSILQFIEAIIGYVEVVDSRCINILLLLLVLLFASLFCLYSSLFDVQINVRY